MKNGFIKNLINNTAIIGIGSALSKLIVFILVPIITRELSPDEYGMSELIVNTVNLLVPIFTLVIFEAILRYTLDKETNTQEALAVGLRVTMVGIMILLPMVFLVSLLWKNYFAILSFLGLYLMSALKNCLVYYARGENRFAIITSVSVIEGIIRLGLVILLVCIYNQGLSGYIMGMFCSGLIGNLLYCFLLRVDILALLRIRNVDLEKKMILYAIPMVFNSIGWWVNNVSDRYMLTFFSGISLVGIYSVSYKIPGILNTIVDVFMQAWKISATTEYEKGRVGHYDKGYRAFLFSSIFICTILICFSKVFSGILFGAEYQEAWRYSSILIIAFLFNGLSGYLGTIFTAVKKTNYIAYSTVVGAVLNIILNLLFIPQYAAMGAAVATMISNIAIWGYRGIMVNRYLKITIIDLRIAVLIFMIFFETMITLRLNGQLTIALVVVISVLCFREILKIKGTS